MSHSTAPINLRSKDERMEKDNMRNENHYLSEFWSYCFVGSLLDFPDITFDIELEIN